MVAHSCDFSTWDAEALETLPGPQGLRLLLALGICQVATLPIERFVALSHLEAALHALPHR